MVLPDHGLIDPDIGREKVLERHAEGCRKGAIMSPFTRRNRFMMLRFIAFFLLLAVSLGAGPASAADPVFPLGSRMGFVPPPGFVASKRFPGFENPDTRSSIVMAILPPQAYA